MPELKKVAPGAGIAACIAAACAIAVPLSQRFEGLRLHPYRDPANIPTVCYGETERAMRDYTPDECAIMLQARQASDYAPAIARCAPGLLHHRNAFAASIDFSYNVGVQSFCASSMARDFNAGRWREGCQAFLLYRFARVNGKLIVLPGLIRRRAAERDLCLEEM